MKVIFFSFLVAMDFYSLFRLVEKNCFFQKLIHVHYAYYIYHTYTALQISNNCTKHQNIQNFCYLKNLHILPLGVTLPHCTLKTTAPSYLTQKSSKWASMTLTAVIVLCMLPKFLQLSSASYRFKNFIIVIARLHKVVPDFFSNWFFCSNFS